MAGDPFWEPRQGLETLRREFTTCNSLNAHAVTIAPRTCEEAQRVLYEIATGAEFPHEKFKPYHEPLSLARKLGIDGLYSADAQKFAAKMQGWALADVEYRREAYDQYTKPGPGNRAKEIVDGVALFIDETEAMAKDPSALAIVKAHQQ